MNKNNQKIKRKTRIRAKVQGSSKRPRLSVFRSNKYIYAQLINDEEGKTILGISEKEIESSKNAPLEQAKKLGILLAKKAQERKIKEAILDKGAYLYHGRVKALAEGAREGGLKF